MHPGVERGHEDESRWAVGVTLNVTTRHDLRSPAGPGTDRRLWHWIEYVVSRPETREAYYRDQYELSAGVIRCIGSERQRYLENSDGLPEWDINHITGVQRLQVLSPCYGLKGDDSPSSRHAWATNLPSASFVRGVPSA